MHSYSAAQGPKRCPLQLLSQRFELCTSLCGNAFRVDIDVLKWSNISIVMPITETDSKVAVTLSNQLNLSCILEFWKRLACPDPPPPTDPEWEIDPTLLRSQSQNRLFVSGRVEWYCRCRGWGKNEGKGGERRLPWSD